VIASGRGVRAEVIAAAPAARARGVRLGSGVAQARACAPDIVVKIASPALETAARDALLDVGLSCAPRAELAPPRTGLFAAEGAVFVDAAGTGRLFGSESGFASALCARAEAQGLPGVVGLAGSRSLSLLVARRIAHEPGRVQVLAPGHESAYLAPLPLDLLDLGDPLAQTLTRLGVRNVRDLLRLPRRGLAHRLGPEVLELIRRTLGEEPDLPLPEPTRRLVEEGLDLEGAVHRIEPLRFVLNGLISRVMDRLSLRGLATGRLEIELSLEGQTRDVRHVSTSAGTRDVRVWLRLALLSLEERPPEAPVEALRVGCEGTPVPRDQLDLFRPTGPDPAQLDRTLSELEALCGEGRVGAPVVADSHRPSAFGLRPFGRPPSRDASPAPPTRRPAQLAMRAIRPPLHAEVRVDRGRPAHIRSALTRGAVLACAGPWRRTGAWWSEDARFAVDHYDVQVDDGTLARLCFDWMGREWLIDGVYD
jgi:protein ImuB